MANLTEYLYQLQKLTEQNISILQALNESFYTKSEHISASIGAGDEKQLFAIPSFLCLEDKINSLQANFENLVNAPKTGVAAFTFDGSTQEIQVKSYSNTPQQVNIPDSINEFKIDKNDVLKDFVSPNPYIYIDLSGLSNDIKYLNIKKIICKNSNLRSAIFGNQTTATKSVEYKDIVAKLDLYEEDKDYIEYDTIQRMPIHTAIGMGEYVIKSIVEDKLDNDFKETYVITTASPLTYTIENGTIEKYIQIGDELTNYTDTVVLTVTDINYATKTITAQVKSGMYVDLTSYDENNADEFCKLKFKSTVEFDKEKHAKVTLEEDDNCIIFIAPVNELNVQAYYGKGISVDTNKLTCVVDGVAYNYLDYYNQFVNNIGDSLLGLTTMVNNTINNLSYEDYTKLSGLMPEITTGTLKVVNINSHLNDSSKVQHIRDLYSQKKAYEQDLATVQNQINDINNILQTNSFNDVNQNRQVYESQLTDLQSKKTELTEYIKSMVNEISIAANDAVIPVEGAKYRVRGYFDHKKFIEDNGLKVGVVKIHAQYRYKNLDSTTGTLKSIDDNFVFPEWTECGGIGLLKTPNFGADNEYHYSYPEVNMEGNEITFNQIDIPITQGEKVELRVKAVYDLGYPLTEFTSEWSNILEIEFPEEFMKDVQILDIIEENNNEVKKNQLQNILEKNGTISHVSDTLIDQDITFLHKPQSIASGFWTPERRVVPLYDKLQEMANNITKLHDEVFGTQMDTPVIQLTCDNNVMTINPFTKNTFLVQPYDMAKNNSGAGNVVTKQIRMDIYNPSNHSMRLYSLFPGNYKAVLMQSARGKVPASDYSTLYSSGAPASRGYGYAVPIRVVSPVPNSETLAANSAQRLSQLFYFRINTPYIKYNGETPLDDIPVVYVDTYENDVIGDGGYSNGDFESKVLNVFKTNNMLWGGAYPVVQVGSGTNSEIVHQYSIKSAYDNKGESVNDGASLYAQINDFSKIQIRGEGDGFENQILNPGECISVDLIFEYILTTMTSIEKTISLDVCTSLYKDPINFEFTVHANKAYDINDKIQMTTTGNAYQPITIN